MLDNFSESESYKIRWPSHAFLQSYDERDGYVLIEFWTNDTNACQRFVDHMNAKVFAH